MVPPKNGGNQSARRNWYYLQKNSPVPSHRMTHSASAPWDVRGMKMAHIATRGRTPWSVGKGTLNRGEDGRFHRC